MSGPLKIVPAEPVSYIECPVCSYPLNVIFAEVKPTGFYVGKERTKVLAMCARCCWHEHWGELKKPTEGETHVGSDRAAAGG